MTQITIPSLPMYFPPSTSNFSLATAQTCAALVGIAYAQFDVWKKLGFPSQSDFASNTTWQAGGPSGFSYSAPIWSTFKIKFVDFSEPFGFVAWDANQNIYAVFRGTMTKADDVMDGEYHQSPYPWVPGFGNVADGFLGVYNGLRQSLLNEINSFSLIKALYVTGHSLGSALSSLAAPDMAFNSSVATAGSPVWHYNFASPRTGDPTFVAAMNGSIITTFRVVNTEDLIPTLPPSISLSTIYQHVGYPINFSAQYGSVDGDHSMADCYNYAINNPTSPFDTSITTALQNVVTARGNAPRPPQHLVIPPLPAAVPSQPPPR